MSHGAEGKRGRSRRRGGNPRAPRTEQPLDSDLPLEALDGALAPVRRALAFAVRSEQVPPFLAAAVQPQLARAAELELVDPVKADVAELAAMGEGLLSTSSDAELSLAVQALFTRLTRLDGLLGLPVPRRVSVPAKRRYVPQVDDDAPRAASPRRSPAPEPRAAVEVAVEAPVEEEPEWNGSADALVDDVLPDAGLPGLTIGDLLSLRPSAHEAVSGVHGAGRDLPTDTLVAVGGRVRTRATVLHPDGSREERRLLVGAGPLWCRWSGPTPHSSLLPEGGRVVLVGRVEGGELVDAEVCGHDAPVGRASYELDEPEHDDRCVREALVRLAPLLDRLRDPVGAETLASLGLPSRGDAYLGLHRTDEEAQEAGRRRLAFDEALLAALGAAGRSGRNERGIPHTVLLSGAATLQRFGVELSDEQQAVFEDIKRDLRRSTPMRRVLTGEVGAGKGSVAVLAMAMVAEGKGQVLVVGPDPAESEHRFLHTEPLLRELGLVARRVADDAGTAVRDAIRRGEIHVVFGTHALLQAELPFRRLGLVVSVERFPFGRGGIAPVGAPRPDLLVLTQVPVGATIACTAYADFEVSVVQHAVRRPARIEVVRATERGSAYGKLREAVARGQQGTVLFPRVRGTDALDLADAHRVVQALQGTELAGCRVGLLHGQQSLEEQRRVFDDFNHRRLDVLVTTLALEDGPALPGLVATVVEQADHVEQWRLHRVIGFLSTSLLPSVAMLVVGEHASSDAEARIQRVLDAKNGYSLTETRVQVRGLEACVAEGTPPRPDFGELSLADDLDLVLAARAEAHRLLRADPNLRRGSHQELARELRDAWGTLWPDAGDDWSCPFTSEGGGDRKRRRRRRRRR